MRQVAGTQARPRSDGALAPVAKPKADQLGGMVPPLLADRLCTASAIVVIPRWERSSELITVIGAALAAFGLRMIEPVTTGGNSRVSALMSGATSKANTPAPMTEP